MPEGPKLFVEPKYPQLYRSRKNRKIAGICGGLAVLTHIDANALRIVMVVACFITGFIPVIIAYIVGIVLIPEQPPSHLR
ncbi:MAG: PspC domain-containing protein [Chlamydiia bacterium]|nr:PspC domain-containing protein [Chlamydiia bacterium]MCP5510219.1 PspC domain-containing protein [Chlamydiales bacterium]